MRIVRLLAAIAALVYFTTPLTNPAFAQTDPYTRFGGSSDGSGNPILPASQLVGATAADIGVGPGGTANYTIPITVPAGTTGVQPSVTLQFSSPGGEGIIGYGGSIGGLSAITRCPMDLYYDASNEPVDYDANDRFCLNGQRLQAITGTYGADATEYRTYTEEFAKIVSYGSAGGGPAWFRVWRKSGEILDFGATADSRIEALGRTAVRVWAINKLSDRQGNYLTYTYSENATTGEFVVTAIDYTGNAAQSLSPYNKVEFTYGTRPKERAWYHDGQLYRDQKRLTQVRTLAGTNVVRTYAITYGVNAQVETIRECYNIGAGQCFGVTDFDWITAETAAAPDYFSAPLHLSNSGILSTSSYVNYAPVATGDVNGDGITDQVVMKLNQYGGKPVEGTVPEEVWLGTATGHFQNTIVAWSPKGTRVLASGDFNGDGRLDLFVTEGDQASATSHRVWLGQSNGQFTKLTTSLGTGLSPSNWGWPMSTSGTEWFQRWSGGDLNGDGRTDLYLIAFKAHRSGSSFIVDERRSLTALSNGDGTFSIVNLPTPTHQRKVMGVGDFNGDGMADILSMSDSALGATASNYINGIDFGSTKKAMGSDNVLLSNGDGTFTTVVLSTNDAMFPAVYRVGAVADFNGDGLTDLYGYQTDSSGNMQGPDDLLWISKGNGTFERIILTGAAAETAHNGFTVAGAGDFDNDGYADIYAYKVSAEFRKAENTADVIWRGGPNNTFVQVTVPIANSIIGKHVVGNVGDFDGNGTADIYTFPGSLDVLGTSNGDSKDYLNRGLSFRYNQISRIGNGLGNLTEFSYKPMTNSSVYTRGTGAVYPVADTASEAEVVSQVRTSNGLGGLNSQTYEYEALREHVRGAGSLGFQKITITDDATGIVSESTYSQDHGNKRQGLLTNAKTIAPSGVVLEDKTVTWQTMLFGSPGATRRIWHYAPQTVTVKKDLNGTNLGTVTETATYDTYGFATQVATTTVDGAITNTKTTGSTYTHDTTNWILGRLSAATTTHGKTGKSNIVRTASFTYGTTGLLTSETVQPGDPLAYTKSYTHNPFGAVTGIAETWGSTATDGITATSRTTTYGYDAQSRFKVSETNPLGHTGTTTYHAVYGLPTATTGPNGLTTSFSYDAFGNPLLETRADGTKTQTWRFYCGGSVVCPANGKFVVISKATGQPLVAVYKDILNRTLQETTVALDGRLIDVKLVYNTKGEVISKSEPTFSGSTPLWTAIEFDILGRPTKTTAPDAGIETTTYNGLVTSSTNALGQVKTLTKNLAGELVIATDAANSTVQYEYDAAGQQTAIIDPLGARTEIDYDIRGNKIAVRDPARGNSTYRSNALGMLVESTDAKGQIASMTFDVLGRMLTRIDDSTAVNPASRTSAWVWDTATKGIGKLTSSSGYGYTATPAYDALGRPSSLTEAMDGYSFATTTSYDSASRIANTVYPSGLTIQNEYALYGHTKKLKNASSGLVYWQLDQSDARGSALQTSLGNGITEYRTYDPAAGTVSTIKSFGPTVGAPAIQDLAYVFDKFGNLTQRSDARQNRSETFVYDNLNRVTSATLESGTTTIDTQTATYDARGNIVTRSDVGTYTYNTTDGCGNAGPHAVKSIAGAINATYCYDANGDMTAGDGRTITWSAFGMPTTIVKGLRQVAFAYGPERARFKRVDTNETGTTTTYYAAGGTYEAAVTPAGQWTTTAYVGGVATVQTVTAGGAPVSTAVRYLLKDHLGSTDVLTDASGAVVTRYAFDGWGKRRDIDWTAYTTGESFLWQSHPVTRGYTFHEQLDPVDLVHMNGRVYDPTIGRFLSADPFVQDVTNTQALNAYSYVLNNPLSYTDPSGFFFSKIFKAIGNAFRAIGRAFMHAVRAIVRSSIGRAILQIAACALVPQGCFAIAGGMTLASGGSLKEAIIAAGISFMQIGAYQGVHGAVQGLSGTSLVVTKLALHAVVGGAVSMAQGGDFVTGALTGAVSAGASLMTDNSGIDALGQSGDEILEKAALRTTVSAVAGGTASVLAGGKFANGAITGAFAQMFNGEDIAGRYRNACENNVRCTSLQRARANAEGRGTGSAEEAQALAEEAAAGLTSRTASSIDRSQFRRTRADYWRNEAEYRGGGYSADDLTRMQSGKPPMGRDGYPMELHHNNGTPTGGLTPMTRTDHRLGDNYQSNHPWLTRQKD